MSEAKENPNEMVTVNLTIKRLYRARHEDRTAIEVGPGMAKVPRWVAGEWKMTPVEEPVKPPDKPKPATKKAAKHDS